MHETNDTKYLLGQIRGLALGCAVTARRSGSMDSIKSDLQKLRDGDHLDQAVQGGLSELLELIASAESRVGYDLDLGGLVGAVGWGQPHLGDDSATVHILLRQAIAPTRQ